MHRSCLSGGAGVYGVISAASCQPAISVIVAKDDDGPHEDVDLSST